MEATDRVGLERPIRYCARPPFALDRLHLVGNRSDQTTLPPPRARARQPRRPASLGPEVCLPLLPTPRHPFGHLRLARLCLGDPAEHQSVKKELSARTALALEENALGTQAPGPPLPLPTPPTVSSPSSEAAPPTHPPGDRLRPSSPWAPPVGRQKGSPSNPTLTTSTRAPRSTPPSPSLIRTTTSIRAGGADPRGPPAPAEVRPEAPGPQAPQPELPGIPPSLPFLAPPIPLAHVPTVAAGPRRVLKMPIPHLEDVGGPIRVSARNGAITGELVGLPERGASFAPLRRSISHFPGTRR